MALPSSGLITLLQIKSEFGGTGTVSLTDYYRNGGLVPNMPQNFDVPTSGLISLTDFYGASSTIYQAVAADTTNTEAGSTSQNVEYELYYDSDGLVRHQVETAGNKAITSIGQWSSAYPSESGAGWSVRVRFLSGTNIYSAGDGLSVWRSLTSDREWVFSETLDPFTNVQGNFIVEISPDGGSTVFDSEQFEVRLSHEGP